MLHKTKGIVFRLTKYGDTSIICKIYTEQFGWQSYIVNGVRKAKGKISFYQPLSLLDLVVYKKENRDLQRISEVKFSHTYHSIPFNIVKSSIGIFLAEVITKSVQEEESNPDLFSYIYNSLLWLDNMKEGVANFHLHFMINLTKYLGLYPTGFSPESLLFDLNEGSFQTIQLKSINPENQIDGLCLEKFTQLLGTPIDKLSSIELNKNIRKELLEKLLVYYERQLEGFRKLKSTSILETVLS